MTEFEFLDKQFSRLRKLRAFLQRDEQEINKQHTGKKVKPFSAYETAELMLSGVIRDYLEMQRSDMGVKK